MKRKEGAWWVPTCLLLALVTGLVYAPMLGGFFRHDDFSWLRVAREWVQSPQGLLALRHGHTGCTPFFNLLFWLLYRQAGLHPFPYYMTLLVSHVGATLLVFWVVVALTRSRIGAAVAGLFYGLHFVHHEAVTWIGSMHRPLALSFLLTSLLLFLHHRRSGRIGSLIGASLLFLLSLFTKEDGLPFLLLLPLLEVGAAPEAEVPKGNRWLGWGVLAATGVLYLMLRPWVATPVGEPGGGEGFYWFGWHIVSNLVRCVPQMLIPDLGFVTYRELLQRFLPPAGVAAAVLISQILGVLVTVLAVVLFLKGRGTTRFGVLWCYVMFLPFAPFSYEFALAPRYLYIPSVGLALLVGLGVQMGDRAALCRGAVGLRRGLWGGLVLVLLVNAALLGWVQKNRLRDSAARRAVLQTVKRCVPDPAANATVYLVDVPAHLRDLTLAVPLLYDVPVKAVWLKPDSPIPKGVPRKEYVVRFPHRD